MCVGVGGEEFIAMLSSLTLFLLPFFKGVIVLALTHGKGHITINKQGYVSVSGTISSFSYQVHASVIPGLSETVSTLKNC